MSKNVLIVVDMQNDFIDGSLGTSEATQIVPKVKEYIDLCRSSGYQIIFTRDTHDENYLNTQEGKNLPVEHCIKGTKGWLISDQLGVHEDDIIIDKPSFGYTQWKDVLGNDVGRIELCGLCTDICVVSNALILKALYPEVPVSVNNDCCAGVTPEKHEAALETMRSCQINIGGVI